MFEILAGAIVLIVAAVLVTGVVAFAGVVAIAVAVVSISVLIIGWFVLQIIELWETTSYAYRRWRMR